ncbi:MAG: bifunctional UDP-N-acetylmuramoyl-tripeptide:D-alanyl-D-alanine ligase/alanine racemase, partial [Bacteroidia bacterium]
FVAIVTDKNNGHNYIEAALKQGSRAILVSQKPTVECDYILVPDTLVALQTLATHHRKKYTIPTIAITGSNGKTIVKEWVSNLLSYEFNVCKSPKSYNSQIGVPLSVWQLKDSHEIGVFEAGISQPNEMANIASVLVPTIGVFTHLGDSHSSNFESNTQKLDEKLKLFHTCETIVCSSNQNEVFSALRRLNKKLFVWGSNVSCDLHITRSSSGEYIVTYKGESHLVSLSKNDKASVENTFMALATAIAAGSNIDKLIDKLNLLPQIDMRLQEIEGVQGNQLIVDYYNSDFQSVSIATDFMLQQKTNDEVTVVLSDILESKIDDYKLYSKLNSVLEKSSISTLIGIGEKISNNRDTFTMDTAFYPSTEDFLKQYPLHELKHQTILIKGARKFEFEKIAERLRKRTHQTSLEVNLSRLQNNLNLIQSKVGKNTKIVAMVKALAYGSGGYQIAKLLENNNIDYLGVAYTDEATQLRSSGITTPIMVLNPDFTDLTPYLEHNIQPVVYSFDSLEKVRGHQVKIHLEFDTGMHRLGFTQNDIGTLIETLQNQNDTEVVSVFSHLAGSDEKSLDEESHKQIQKFSQICDKLSSTLQTNFIRHIANTAAIERLPSAIFDMVRLGIGLYGISSLKGESELLPVGTFKSYISQIKTVNANEGVGYGFHSKADHKRQIAVVAVGYADGFSRSFSQGVGSFYINGKKAPIVGNVCMDMTMCDVTDISCIEGDEVTIFGDTPRVEELAKNIDTIPYEILANVSARVNRVYFQE